MAVLSELGTEKESGAREVAVVKVAMVVAGGSGRSRNDGSSSGVAGS